MPVVVGLAEDPALAEVAGVGQQAAAREAAQTVLVERQLLDLQQELVEDQLGAAVAQRVRVHAPRAVEHHADRPENWRIPQGRCPVR